MESIRGLVLFTLAVLIAGVRSNQDDLIAKKSDETKLDLEQRVRVLETKLQRVEGQLSEMDQFLDAWFQSVDQKHHRGGKQQQHQSIIVSTSALPNYENADEAGDLLEKRGGGGFSFMGSRGKRKQPFILGSRGKKRSLTQQLDDDQAEVDKRGAYFYGSRGKKRAFLNAASSFGDEQQQRIAAAVAPQYNHKRYTFMGSRGRK